MALVVQKYGGSSVGSPQKILSVAERIHQSHISGDDLVIVVSAMGDTTNQLLKLAQDVSFRQIQRELFAREMDMLLTAGERISMALLSMALADLGVKAVSFTGSQSGVITTHHHQRARIIKIYGDRIRKALSEKNVVIVAGFQGVSENKEIMTLGRGGSDTSAAALAVSLGASRCEIYTDVDGVFTADPFRVKEARLIEKISYEALLELSLKGAKVMHSRSVEIARRSLLPLWVKGSQSLSRGTEVVSKENMECPEFIAVTSNAQQMLLKISLQRESVAGALYDQLEPLKLDLNSLFFESGSISCFIDRNQESTWKSVLDQLTREGFVKEYFIYKELAPITVVGHGVVGDVVLLRKMTEILASLNISATIGVASSTSATMAVPLTRLEESERLLHSKLVE